MTFYNEIDPFAVDWLANLKTGGHITDGRIDARSVAEIQPADVAGVERAHFFAGIGCWDYALTLAGWPAGLRVWTGSCPCQPFSAAGKRGGVNDARHLWPEWFRLIEKCRPPVVFGEQVASVDGLHWLDAVLADLEGAGYAVGATDLSAAGFGAPHLRQRFYFVANTDGWRQQKQRPPHEQGTDAARNDVDRRGSPRLMGKPAGPGLEGQWNQGAARSRYPRGTSERAGPTRGFWGAADWVPCTDGASRPVEPGSFPLAHGVAARVGRLRAYGNAIAAPVAADFVRAFLAC